MVKINKYFKKLNKNIQIEPPMLCEKVGRYKFSPSYRLFTFLDKRYGEAYGVQFLRGEVFLHELRKIDG